MAESIVAIIGSLGTAVGLITTMLFSKRAKNAEVRLKEIKAHSEEISTADQLVELIKKTNQHTIAMIKNANEEVLEKTKKENEKLRRTLRSLEKAISSISTCPHRDVCPIPEQLQSHKDSSES